MTLWYPLLYPYIIIPILVCDAQEKERGTHTLYFRTVFLNLFFLFIASPRALLYTFLH